MTQSLYDRLTALGGTGSLVFNRGIEREALRVTPSGSLALTPHPAFLGSKLTHPLITTDFCESQLELITGVHQKSEDVLGQLLDTHRFVYSGLSEELIWSASMPCVLQKGDEIPLAYYGESNLGRLKTTYRNGLGHRYGRAMQTICAVHYNFSFSDDFWENLQQLEGATGSLQDFRSKRYFDLARNFRRYSWMLTYLFGASPAVCNSFLRGREHALDQLDEGTAYLPFATSLRSGNLGYQSDTQSEKLKVCYNSLDSYVRSIAQGICEEYPKYRDIGTRSGDEYLQVNQNVLQSEAEFYSTIRAKCVPPKGKNFLAHLLEVGVEYIEVRLLDVNPYLPLGIDDTQIHFLDTFLTWCLLTDSPLHDDLLCNEVQENMRATVREGRNPDLLIHDNGTQRSLREWGESVLSQLKTVALALDEAAGSNRHAQSLLVQGEKFSDADKTPSGAILQDLRSQSIPFFRFAMNKALAHEAYFRETPPSADELEYFNQLAAQSRESQLDLEIAGKAPGQPNFDDYLVAIQDTYIKLLT